MPSQPCPAAGWAHRRPARRRGLLVSDDRYDNFAPIETEIPGILTMSGVRAIVIQEYHSKIRNEAIQIAV